MNTLDDICLPDAPPLGLSEVRTSLGLHVLNVHYTADPNKRDPKWKAHYKKGWDARDWAREFEIDWTVADGKPVFEEFDKGKHISTTPLRVTPGQPIYLGWDFGLNPAVVFLQVVQGQVRVLAALTDENKTMVNFAPAVVEMMLALHRSAGFETWATRWQDIVDRAVAQQEALDALEDEPADRHIPRPLSFASAVASALNIGEDAAFEWIHFGDPYGNQRSDSDGETTYRTLKRYFIHIKQGKQAWQKRRNAVSERLSSPDIPGVGPAFLVSNDPSCDLLTAGFHGGYKYADSADTGGRELPVKDKFSHVQDALQYPLTMLFPDGSTQAEVLPVVTDFRPLLTGQAPPTSERTGGPMMQTLSFSTRTQRAAQTAWNPWIQSQSDT